MQDKPEIVIYGAGGHGKAVIDLARACGYRVAALADDGFPAGSEVLGVPVVGGSASLAGLRASGLACAANAIGGIGNPAVRQRVFELLRAAGFSLPPLVHPRAYSEPSAVIEDGVQVMPLAYVGTLARVGFGSVVNIGAIVSHDVILEQINNLSPGAALAGGVRLGALTQVGMNATINVHVQVGPNCLIGNGATVKKDVPPGTRVWAGTIWPPRAA